MERPDRAEARGADGRAGEWGVVDASLDLNGRITAYERLAHAVGRLVLSFSSLELELDDLLHLANERLRISETVSRYPVQITQKLEALPVIRASLRVVPNLALSDQEVLEIISFRNAAAHGQVTSVVETSHGFWAHFAKMGRPVKDGKLQHLKRETYSLREQEFLDFHIEIRKLFQDVEAYRLEVWRMFDGWPNYIPLNGADPFGYTTRKYPNVSKDD